MHYPRKAFTLIELLVVIGIIMVLLGILLPVVNKSREQGRMAACMSNQHEVFVAFQAFYQANNETSPGACGTIPSSGPGTANFYGVGQLTTTSDALTQATLERTSRSVLLIRGYLKTSATFHCPQQDAVIGQELAVTGSNATFQYVFNEFFVGNMPCVPSGTLTGDTTFFPVYNPTFPSFQAAGIHAITFNRSQNPSRCVLITEDGMLAEDGSVHDWSHAVSLNPHTPQETTYIHAFPWHKIRANKSTDKTTYVMADAAVCTYLDGHTALVDVGTWDALHYYTVPSDHIGLPR